MVTNEAGSSAVDGYLRRCERWPDVLVALRPVLLGAGLTESVKWGKPCYSAGGRNIAIVQEMKDFLALMFFKGALLTDPEGLLAEQGPNSRSARRVTFTTAGQVGTHADAVAAFVAEAIALEAAGATVPPAPPLVLVVELAARLEADPVLAAAFDALTPGRRREYHLYVSGAKQPATRVARVERCVEQILAGKGLRDR
jgi:uncharacterized protein YdeI (YjbR/CyaY-like superfamily)